MPCRAEPPGTGAAWPWVAKVEPTPASFRCGIQTGLGAESATWARQTGAVREI